MAAQDEPPLKKRRLSIELEIENVVDGNAQDENIRKEVRCGITNYVVPSVKGFSGILKTRYTDFLVNEVLPNGQVLHLQSLSPPSRVRNIAATANKDEIAESNGSPGGLTALAEKKEQNTNDDKNGTAWKEVDIKEANTALMPIFGEDTAEKIIDLYTAILQSPSKKPKDFRAVKSDQIADKQQRTEAHQLIRRLFESRLDTRTAESESILITAAAATPSARGGATGGSGTIVKNRLGWQELGGEYMHFTLYKENRDTMEAISYLSSQLKVGPKHFQFGGTKDRRAVTAQRCSVYRIHAEQLANVGKRLRGSKVGDFEYQPCGLELGMLGGNEFVITLRDCHVAEDQDMSIAERVTFTEKKLSFIIDSFKKNGFINYYGLQRFGSFAVSTDEVGLNLLQGDLASAVEKILDYNSVALDDSQSLISEDDKSRAKAINLWNTSQDSVKALEILPRKFSAESSIIRHLGLRNKKTGLLSSLRDYQGALQSIPRNLRLMYLHAYQSRVWNLVAGKRWEMFGSKVIPGDLVLISKQSSKQTGGADETQDVDEQGEPIILPSKSRGGENHHLDDSPYERARPLTAEEAASSEYSIFDIVLPLPGYDVVYPENDIGEEFKKFMSSDAGGGLDPHDMRRSWKDLSLSGSYRKLLGRPGEGMRFEAKPYERDEEQLVKTDLDRLQEKKLEGAAQVEKPDKTHEMNNFEEEGLPKEKRLAIILWMKLSPSQYATMALRELMKGGLKPFKPEFSSSR